MLILRCMHLGELLCPLPGEWLSGSCLSPGGLFSLGALLSPMNRMTPGGTIALAAASSPALELAPAVTTAVSQSALAWMLPGGER